MENEKVQRVLAAARTVFLRYGFRRVAMRDIAEAAGISRPALYLVFCNKEEVFTAAIRDMTANSLNRIRAELSSHPTLEAKLRFAFEIWTVEAFALLLTSPDAKDLLECTQGFAREAMQSATENFEALLVDVLQSASNPAKTNAGLSAAQIAHLLAASIHGFKEAATTVEELRGMVHGLIALTLAAIQVSPEV